MDRAARPKTADASDPVLRAGMHALELPGCRAVGWVALWLSAAFACSTAPAIRDPVAALAATEQMLEANDPAADQSAYDLLTAFDDKDYAGEDQARYKLRLATSLARLDEPWTAYRTIREFADDHGFSAYRPGVEDLMFQVGNRLIRGSTGFSLYGSERSRGIVVLERFVTQYPRHRQVPEALRLLGEAAFLAEEWILSRERFTSIVTDHPDSEWVPLAKFKIAMARYRTLVGPSYDRQAMIDAHNELRDFLAIGIDNPQFRGEAEAALRTVRGWLGQKELEIADFYKTIGNAMGERRHLERAAEEFSETEAGKLATATLQKRFGVEKTDAPQGPPDTGDSSGTPSR